MLGKNKNKILYSLFAAVLGVVAMIVMASMSGLSPGDDLKTSLFLDDPASPYSASDVVFVADVEQERYYSNGLPIGPYNSRINTQWYAGSNNDDLVPFKTYVYYNNPNSPCNKDYTDSQGNPIYSFQQEGFNPEEHNNAADNCYIGQNTAFGHLWVGGLPILYDKNYTATVGIFTSYKSISTDDVFFAEPYIDTLVPCLQSETTCASSDPFSLHTMDPKSQSTKQGGTAVTITGEGFSALIGKPNVSLKFVSKRGDADYNATATDFTIVNDTTITATTPDNLVGGQVDVILIDEDSVDYDLDILDGIYLYPLPLRVDYTNPRLDHVEGGRTVYVYGAGFASLQNEPSAYVEFDGVRSPQPPILAYNYSTGTYYDNFMFAEVPPQAEAGENPVSITVSNGRTDQNEDSATWLGNFNYVDGLRCVWTDCQKITPDDIASFDSFGGAVDIDGDVAAIGAARKRVFFSDINGQYNAGVVYLYEKDENGQWQELAKVEPPSDNVMNYQYFGDAVSIEGDTLVVGAWRRKTSAGFEAGSAFIYEKPAGSSWADINNVTPVEIVASDGAAYDRFGISVALSGDVVVVGASSDDILDGTGVSGERSGAAYVFKKDASTGAWNQIGKVKPYDPDLYTGGSAYSIVQFGIDVAIEGNLIAVGAEYNDAVQVYTVDGNTVNLAKVLKVADIDVRDRFGKSVALSNGKLVVGTPDGTGKSGVKRGSAYVFSTSEGSEELFNLTNIIELCDGSTLGRFGTDVDIDGDLLVVGATGETVEQVIQGISIVFEYNGNTWTPVLKSSPYLNNDDLFGGDVSISENDIIVGAIRADQRSRGDWTGVVAAFEYTEPDIDSFNCPFECIDYDDDGYFRYNAQACYDQAKAEDPEAVVFPEQDCNDNDAELTPANSCSLCVDEDDDTFYANDGICVLPEGELFDCIDDPDDPNLPEGIEAGEVYPGKNDLCNGFDDNCNNIIDEDFPVYEQTTVKYGSELCYEDVLDPQTGEVIGSEYVVGKIVESNGSQFTCGSVDEGGDDRCYNAVDDICTPEGVIENNGIAGTFAVFPDFDVDGYPIEEGFRLDGCFKDGIDQYVDLVIGENGPIWDCNEAENDPNQDPNASLKNPLASDACVEDANGIGLVVENRNCNAADDGELDCGAACGDIDNDKYYAVDPNSAQCPKYPEGDCDDMNANINPGVAEDVCDGVDANCDGVVEEDADEDGYLNCAECDDNDKNNYPENTEVCDGSDNNCDNLEDEADPLLVPDVTIAFYDVDGDGYGDAESFEENLCRPLASDLVEDNTDCSVDNPNVNPGVEEICGNEIDDNCNGAVDEGCRLDAASYKTESIVKLDEVIYQGKKAGKSESYVREAQEYIVKSLGNKAEEFCAQYDSTATAKHGDDDSSDDDSSDDKQKGFKCKGDKHITWLDDNTLTCQKGQKVFNHEENAVKKLLKAIDKGGLTAEGEAVVNEVINMLIEADKTLTEIAVENSDDPNDTFTEYDPANFSQPWNVIQAYRQDWHLTCVDQSKKCDEGSSDDDSSGDCSSDDDSSDDDSSDD